MPIILKMDFFKKASNATAIKLKLKNFKNIFNAITLFNSLLVNDSFPYPLKTFENQRFSDVFRVNRKRNIDQGEVKNT